MRALVFDEVTVNGRRLTATLPERKVKKGTRAFDRASIGENIERAVNLLSAATSMPRHLAENIVRWRARRGYVLVAAEK